MICQACGKELTETEMQSGEVASFPTNIGEVLAHSCNPLDLPDDKRKRYKEVAADLFTMNDRIYFGLVSP